MKGHLWDWKLAAYWVEMKADWVEMKADWWVRLHLP